MQTAVIYEYSKNPDKFIIETFLKKPAIKPTEVLIKNMAASVNPIDILKRQGYGKKLFERIRPLKFPYILGCDGAGVVEAVGNKVSEFNVGDEVYYAVVASQPGTYTEYIAVESKQVSLKPNNLNFVEAASIPYVALTTWAALVTKAKLDPCKAMGKKILVHGGSGGVGSFAIQLLKSWGCFVATTCSTKNYDFVKSLGADIVIDYTKETFNQKISDFDIVFDTVGSKTQGMEEKSISILKKNKSSCYVTIVHPIMRNFDQYGLIVGMIVNVFQGFKKSIRYRKIRYKWALYKPNSAAFKTVTPLIQQEKIKPVIDRLFRLEEVAEAHAYMSHQRLRGKVILTINET